MLDHITCTSIDWLFNVCHLSISWVFIVRPNHNDNDNDKRDKRCVWCQNFAGFKSTCFEPPNPVKKNCPMVLGWDWGKSLIDYLNTRCSYKSMKGVGPKKNELLGSLTNQWRSLSSRPSVVCPSPVLVRPSLPQNGTLEAEFFDICLTLAYVQTADSLQGGPVWYVLISWAGCGLVYHRYH